MAFGLAALYARLTRTGVLEVQGEDCIRTARAKGLPRGTGGPAAHHAADAYADRQCARAGPGALVGGAIVAEVMFGLPGLAQAPVQALLDLDLP